MITMSGKFLEAMSDKALKNLVFALRLNHSVNTQADRQLWKSALSILHSRGKSPPSVL